MSAPGGAAPAAAAAPLVPAHPSPALENFLATVKALSAQGNFHELSTSANNAAETLQRNSAHLLAASDMLELQQHSLGLMAIYSALLTKIPSLADWDDIFNRISLFIVECNGEQIRYAAVQFADLCHLFADELLRRETPMMGIPLLMKAVSKLQLNDTTLTSVHSDVCKLCLAAKCFSFISSGADDGTTNNSFPLIRTDFRDVSKEAAADPKYILLYFYYGGMILTAIKDYSRALYFFEVSITIPAMAVSHIMLEAYKKYLLVFLIAEGHKPREAMNLPKYTSPVVIKYIKPLCAPYNNLVNAFYANKSDELKDVAAKYSDVFATDQNSGLVAQVLSSHLRTNIKRLTRTFVTLSLSELASRVGLDTPQEAEQIVVQMIDEGRINARISQKDGMVRFDTQNELFNSVAFLDRVEAAIEGCISLDRQISALDEEIVLNQAFVKKSSALSGGGTSSGGGGTAREVDEDYVSAGAVAASSSTSSNGAFGMQY